VPVKNRRARRLFARALVVLGGSLAGTAAAWAISAAGASADPLPQHQAPDAGQPTIVHSVQSSADDLLNGQQESQQDSSLPKQNDLNSGDLNSVVKPATETVHKVDTALWHAAPPKEQAAQQDPVSDVSGELQGTARSAGDKLRDGLAKAGGDLRDNIGRQLEPITRPLKPVTAPLRPITQPLDPVRVPGLGAAPPAHLPTPIGPHGDAGATTHPPRQHAAEAGQGSAAPQSAAKDSDNAFDGLHLPAGGLPLVPNAPDNDQPFAPLNLPGGSGSTGHDSSSFFTSHGPPAGDRSDVPLLPDPALVRALVPDEDRLNVNLAEQPGTTPD
jgi:hypothetical protein